MCKSSVHIPKWMRRSRKAFIYTPVVFNRLTRLEEDICEIQSIFQQSMELLETVLAGKADHSESYLDDTKVQSRNTRKLEGDPGNLQDRAGQVEAENAKLKAQLSTYVAEICLLKKNAKTHLRHLSGNCRPCVMPKPSHQLMLNQTHQMMPKPARLPSPSPNHLPASPANLLSPRGNLTYRAPLPVLSVP